MMAGQIPASGSPPEGLLPAYVGLRPIRVGVFVPEVPNVPWHRAWENALAHQARFWGGSANVPFPLDETLKDDGLFWALADRLDPDGWIVHTGKLADLASLDPDRYADERAALAEAFEREMPPAVAAGPVNIRLEEPLVEEWVSEDWRDLLRRRGASIDLPSVTPSTSGDQHDAPPYPFTDVLSFQDLPEDPILYTTELGGSRAAAAYDRGRQSH